MYLYNNRKRSTCCEMGVRVWSRGWRGTAGSGRPPWAAPRARTARAARPRRPRSSGDLHAGGASTLHPPYSMYLYILGANYCNCSLLTAIASFQEYSFMFSTSRIDFIAKCFTADAGKLVAKSEHPADGVCPRAIAVAREVSTTHCGRRELI